MLFKCLVSIETLSNSYIIKMLFEFLVTAALLGLAIYILLISKGSPPHHWKKYKIPIIDSSVVASNFEILLGKKSIMHRDDFAYVKLGSEKFCGMLESPDPVILLKDLDLIKKIFIKDFHHFIDRRDFFPVKSGVIRKMLGMLKGQEWRDVRIAVSPAFTSGKFRRMMEHFNSIGNEWVQMLKTQCTSNPSGSTTIDVLNTVNQYVVDVIGIVVFGLNTGTIKDPTGAFGKYVGRLTEGGLIDFIKLNLGPRYPKFFLTMGIEILDREAVGFFEQILRQSLQARQSGQVKRNDFQQLLLEAQKGELKAVGSDELSAFEKDGYIESDKNSKQLTLSDDMLAAQGLLFFLAGFQTTSTFISFCAYLLVAHPDMQNKLRTEVDAIFKDDGSVDYDDLSALVFMDMFICEVLRHFPAAIRLERVCTADYYDPDSGLFVPKNGVVIIPVNAIHHDSRYYPNPDKFNPENFSPEQKAERNPYTYLPFGMGPRHCIGMRFALMESKTAIAHLVHHFKIEPTSKTPLPLQGMPTGLQWLTPKNLELRLTPIN